MQKSHKTVALVGAVIVAVAAVAALTPKKCHKKDTQIIDGVQTQVTVCTWKGSCTPNPPWKNGWPWGC